MLRHGVSSNVPASCRWRKARRSARPAARGAACVWCGPAIRGLGPKQGSGSFLKKRTKKLSPVCGGLARAQREKVFLLLFLQKKKILMLPF
jgi:hypothetical protein